VDVLAIIGLFLCQKIRHLIFSRKTIRHCRGVTGYEIPGTGGSAYEKKPVKNVGSVRFELTIDGSLRYASELQRVITNSADPLFITRTRPLEPVAIPD
jgi:hypothetical protein